MKKAVAIILLICIMIPWAAASTDSFGEDTGVFLETDELLNWVLPTSGSEGLAASAKGAILMEAQTGEILFEKNPDEKLPIASVTKIMTLLLVMEALDGGMISLDDPVTVSENAASMGGSQAWMEPGETLSVHEMLKAVVVSSCNDGAVALAEHIAGSEAEFVSKMNIRAKELGMANAEFVNCTGLDDNEMHLSCARDVAIMSRELIKHEKIFEYTTIWMDTIRSGEFGLSNTNKLIRFYNGANGLKTGSTSKAKFCLSATAKRGDMQLIAVVLGCESGSERFADAKGLLDWGFANYAIFTPSALSVNSIAVKGGKKNSVLLDFDPTPLLVKKGTETKVSVSENIQEVLTAPVDKHQTVGEVIYSVGDKEISRQKVYTSEGVEKVGYFDVFIRLLKSIF